jgi:hypothetical protein
MSDELKFHDLSSRHYGLTDAVSSSYAEAACVCLDRHHSPAVEFAVEDNSVLSTAAASWPSVDARVKAAWNNTIDTTELGACALALAAVEHSRGLVAIRRAETRTGADYYVDKPGSAVDDLETSFRLEVSGVDSGTSDAVRYRLNQKIKQTKAGNSNLPAIACVVGFAALRISAADAT